MNTSKFSVVVAGLVENMPDVFLLRKDWEELVLLMKGNTPEFLEEERERLLERIKPGGQTDPLPAHHRDRHAQKTDRRAAPILCRSPGQHSKSSR